MAIGIVTPAQVFRTLIDGVAELANGDVSQVEKLSSLYAESTHVVHPMSPLIPVFTSRADMYSHFADVLNGPRMRLKIEDVHIHQTFDPEVIIAEFTCTGDGSVNPLCAHCIFVLRVRDGQILESRDYVDNDAFARAANQSACGDGKAAVP